MRARMIVRTVGGVLLVAVLIGQPAAASPASEADRTGWMETVAAWWGELVDRLVGNAAGGSENDGGPEIDPVGANASGEEEGDGGPSIDPIG